MFKVYKGKNEGAGNSSLNPVLTDFKLRLLHATYFVSQQDISAAIINYPCVQGKLEQNIKCWNSKPILSPQSFGENIAGDLDCLFDFQDHMEKKP